MKQRKCTFRVNKKTNINLIPTFFLPSNFCYMSAPYTADCLLEITLLCSSSIMWLQQRRFRPVTMLVGSFLKLKCGCFSLGLISFKIEICLQCLNVGRLIITCFKISSSSNSPHANVKVTLSTANKRGFQLGKSANRNKSICISTLQLNKNGVWYWLSLPGKARPHQC